MKKSPKIIYNRLLPFKSFAAINLFSVIFARKEYEPLSQNTIRHELIHTTQMREWLYIGFYLIYIIEWIFKGYQNISFEKEAYKFEKLDYYLDIRPRYNNYRHII